MGESMTHPSKYFRNNVLSGLNVSDAAVAAGCGSLSSVPPARPTGFPGDAPLDESLPQRPINPYGESKLMFERVLHWYPRDPRT